jgi:hypothetical protein
MARPQRTYAFGALQQTLGYHADGTLALRGRWQG